MAEGFDRFGHSYATLDILGNAGRAGYVLTGMSSTDDPVKIWVLDSGQLLQYEVDINAGVVDNDGFNAEGEYDAWKYLADKAHAQGLSGYWPEGRWHDFTYWEVFNNQSTKSLLGKNKNKITLTAGVAGGVDKSPGTHFLIQRENGGGGAADMFVTQGDGTARTAGKQYYWIPLGATKHDPTSGEYYLDGVRYFNNGKVWVQLYDTHADIVEGLQDTAKAAAVIVAIAASAGAFSAVATGAAVVGAPVVEGSVVVSELGAVGTTAAASTASTAWAAITGAVESAVVGGVANLAASATSKSPEPVLPSLTLPGEQVAEQGAGGDTDTKAYIAAGVSVALLLGSLIF